MFAVRRIFRGRKTLTNYICTSNVVKCDESKKSNEARNEETNDTKRPDKNEKRKPGSRKTPRNIKNLFGLSNEEQNRSKTDFKESPFSKKTKMDSKGEFQTDFFKKILAPSVEKVAEDLGGDENKTKEDLLEYIKTFEVKKAQQVQSRHSKNYIFLSENFSSESAKSLFDGAKGLNIFDPAEVSKWDDKVKLNIWDNLEAEELEYKSLQPPRNYFEELIQWTNEGKLWHFPIDNDQGSEEEAKVSFTEHVFLEQYLEPWCPKKGPIRKFMELVLIGLSKNPYLRVEEKKEHIKWFEIYFESKKKLLQELGAVGATKELDP